MKQFQLKPKKDIPTEPKHPYDNTTGPLIKKANGTNRGFYGKWHLRGLSIEDKVKTVNFPVGRGEEKKMEDVWEEIWSPWRNLKIEIRWCDYSCQN